MKIIHTIILDKNKFNDSIKKNIESWIINNPNYKVLVWLFDINFSFDDQWIENHIENIRFIPEFILSKFDNIQDLNSYFKIWLMKNHGGFFIDCSMKCIKSLDEFKSDTLAIDKDLRSDFLFGLNNTGFYKRLLSILDSKSERGESLENLTEIMNLVSEDFDDLNLITIDYFATKPRLITEDTLFTTEKCKSTLFSRLKYICNSIFKVGY